MNKELLTFKTFIDPDIAKDIAEKLENANIQYVLEDDTKFFNPTFTRDPIQNEIRLKIYSTDFLEATAILEEYYKAQLDSIDRSYYLFDFTNTELQEILEKPDEWGELDNQLAQKILKERGNEISENEVSILKSKRIEELSKQKTIPAFGIYIAYLFSITGCLLGLKSCVFGIIIGLFLSTIKTTLPNGQSFFTYVDKQRKHGKAIVAIGLISLCVYFCLYVFFNYRLYTVRGPWGLYF